MIYRLFLETSSDGVIVVPGRTTVVNPSSAATVPLFPPQLEWYPVASLLSTRFFNAASPWEEHSAFAKILPLSIFVLSSLYT